ncbi:heptosyltransferase [Achromobacter xylosoxidans]|jgi:heptosyltransferase-2|uniref:glycosyltransferase family 9 protein n=1 Tax=Achromobacter TaxID=222 RepID=UPI0006FF1418|nr:MULTISPECIES: glycosyltransferase family 9 protein [Achromobacter]KXJ67624.1 heptosyltransferase [Achromobacter xylosoxidans]KRB15546.1 heptosyltransferase [Achromobacter sp. Root170]MCU6615496.1 glycosyltransferase family 9 protein [Achromobacter mucicolens]TQJ93764.1 heptosyltransferase-2 [Achromobacter sp. SLBN-14]WBX90018.1 glycosyltransferase family 9 protein [Achromobacter mucicolens]
MSDISCLYVRLPNWVGDVCMSLPSLRALAASGLPLVLCARPWARDLLDGVDKLDFVPMRGKVGPDRAAVSAHRRGLGAQGRRARGLLLPDSLSSALVFRLAGVPSAGYRDDGRSFLLRWPFAKPDQPMHAVESWHHLTREALIRWNLPSGPAQPGPTLDLPLTAAHERAAGEALAQAGLQDRPFVLIAPTATGLHKGRIKVWPGFDTLTRALQARGHTVVMCPPPAETDEARRNAPTAQLLPPLGLGAFAALTARAALVICNDSGVSHVAAAASARQLTLFGVTQPQRTGPWSPRAVCLGSDQAWPSQEEATQQAERLLDGTQ